MNEIYALKDLNKISLMPDIYYTHFENNILFAIFVYAIVLIRCKPKAN